MSVDGGVLGMLLTPLAVSLIEWLPRDISAVLVHVLTATELRPTVRHEALNQSGANPGLRSSGWC
jgi:hypothetical protein